jgi:RecB family exonuclease
VPSRWLNRLLNLLSGHSENNGPKAIEEMRGRGAKWLDWATETKNVKLQKPAKRPSPKPPKDTRPKKLSVTEIKTLIRDPYAIYAKHILKLKPLRPLHETADPLLRGVTIHKIFEQFVKNWQQDFSELDQKKLLLDFTKKQLTQKVASPTAQLFWFSRVEKIADWFVSEEANRRNLCKPIALEKKGRIVIPSLGFKLTAQVDRVDINQNGEAVIYDYKTGAVPNKNVQLHFDKQLFLLSLIVEDGGFSDIAPLNVSNASFIDLSNKKVVLAPFDQESLETHRSKFHLLIERYLNPDQGFTARRAMFRIEDNSDYDGISRFGEWSIEDEVQ